MIDFNTMFPTHTLSQHRRITIAFRDKVLLEIFTISLKFLGQVNSGTVPEHMQKEVAVRAGELCFACLSFDFIGTTPDESSDDVGIVQIPKTWKNFFEEDNILPLLFEVYTKVKSKVILRCLGHAASTRVSLFYTNLTKMNFIESLIKGLYQIIVGNIGLEDESRHHEFCRLLTRLKSNFSIKQISAAEGFRQFLPVLAQFSCQTFQSWQKSPNSVYYILELWREMVKGSHFLEDQEKNTITQFTPQLIQVYTQSRTQSVAVAFSDDSVDDPLRSGNMLEEEIKSLPALLRAHYETNSKFLKSMFEPIAKNFFVLVSNNISSPSKGNSAQLGVVEGQLTWLVYFIGAGIGGRLLVGNTDEKYASFDAELTSMVFQLLNMHNKRLPHQNSCTEFYTERLEIALLKFIQHFRKVYIGDNSVSTSSIFPILEQLVGIGSFKTVISVFLNKMFVSFFITL